MKRWVSKWEETNRSWDLKNYMSHIRLNQKQTIPNLSVDNLPHHTRAASSATPTAGEYAILFVVSSTNCDTELWTLPARTSERLVWDCSCPAIQISWLNIWIWTTLLPNWTAGYWNCCYFQFSTIPMTSVNAKSSPVNITNESKKTVACEERGRYG